MFASGGSGGALIGPYGIVSGRHCSRLGESVEMFPLLGRDGDIGCFGESGSGIRLLSPFKVPVLGGVTEVGVGFVLRDCISVSAFVQ